MTLQQVKEAAKTKKKKKKKKKTVIRVEQSAPTPVLQGDVTPDTSKPVKYVDWDAPDEGTME